MRKTYEKKTITNRNLEKKRGKMMYVNIIIICKTPIYLWILFYLYQNRDLNK